MTKKKPITDDGIIIASSVSGWPEFRIEACIGGGTDARVGAYLVRFNDGGEWIEVDRETYLAAVATAQHERLMIHLGNITDALRRAGNHD